jgi:hypothetical protein
VLKTRYGGSYLLRVNFHTDRAAAVAGFVKCALPGLLRVRVTDSVGGRQGDHAWLCDGIGGAGHCRLRGNHPLSVSLSRLTLSLCVCVRAGAGWAEHRAVVWTDGDSVTGRRRAGVVARPALYDTSLCLLLLSRSLLRQRQRWRMCSCRLSRSREAS